MYLEKDRLGCVRAPHDACKIVHIVLAPRGHRTNIVRCPYSDRKNCTGIVRFFGANYY